MEKEFVLYEQALALKELGFDEPCFGKFYFNQLEIGGNWCNNDFKEDPDVFISAPLYQQAFRWFREKYKPEEINFYIHLLDTHSTPKKYLPCYTIRKGVNVIEVKTSDTYEKAELECLKKLIEIVKNK